MDWNSFYEKRINSSYQRYFEFRYAPFLLEVLQRSQGKVIIDAGCGIGSVSKYVQHHNDVMGFDICPNMVELSKRNVPNVDFRVADLTRVTNDFFTVTHGVLEHFEDDVIQQILDNNPNSIHYVPLEGYEAPSFGDERLLPKDFWLDTFKPKSHGTFNNGLDLYFVA